MALPSRPAYVPGGAGTRQSALQNVTAPAIRVPKTRLLRYLPTLDEKE